MTKQKQNKKTCKNKNKKGGLHGQTCKNKNHIFCRSLKTSNPPSLHNFSPGSKVGFSSSSLPLVPVGKIVCMKWKLFGSIMNVLYAVCCMLYAKKPCWNVVFPIVVLIVVKIFKSFPPVCAIWNKLASSVDAIAIYKTCNHSHWPTDWQR